MLALLVTLDAHASAQGQRPPCTLLRLPHPASRGSLRHPAALRELRCPAQRQHAHEGAEKPSERIVPPVTRTERKEQGCVKAMLIRCG